MDLVQLIAIPSLAASVGAALTGIIIQKTIDRGFQRDIEKYKSDLELQRFEYQSRKALLHKEQAKIVGIVYGRLVKASMLLAKLTHFLQSAGENLGENKERSWRAWEKADHYFNEHRIYLDKDISDRVHEILEKMRGVIIAMEVGLSGEKYSRDETGLWKKSYEQVKFELPPLLEILECQFRNLLAGGATND